MSLLTHLQSYRQYPRQKFQQKDQRTNRVLLQIATSTEQQTIREEMMAVFVNVIRVGEAQIVKLRLVVNAWKFMLKVTKRLLSCTDYIETREMKMDHSPIQWSTEKW